jgi:hypothetical protein
MRKLLRKKEETHEFLPFTEFVPLRNIPPPLHDSYGRLKSSKQTLELHGRDKALTHPARLVRKTPSKHSKVEERY